MNRSMIYLVALCLLCSCGSKDPEIKDPYFEIKGEKVDLKDLHLGDYDNISDRWTIERRLDEVKSMLFPSESITSTASASSEAGSSLSAKKLTGWDKIDRDLEMEDFDEINEEMKNILTEGKCDLKRAEKVWKELNRHYIKTNDEKAYNEFISTVNLYTIGSKPQANYKYGVEEATRTTRDWSGPDNKKIVPSYPAAYNAENSCKSYAEDATAFNDIVDDLVDEAVMQGNVSFARKALVLYRKDLVQHYDMEGEYESNWSNSDTRTWWEYSDKSKNEAQQRIAAAK